MVKEEADPAVEEVEEENTVVEVLLEENSEILQENSEILEKNSEMIREKFRSPREEFRWVTRRF